MEEKQRVYPHVLPEIEDWPIYQLHQDRRRFIEQICEFTMNRLLRNDTAAVTDIIARTIYLERIRIKEEPWKVDPPKERQFWRKVQHQLVGKSLDRDPREAQKINEEILRQIVRRYAEEIVGTFRKKTFLFARWFLTMFFTRLLNTAAGRHIYRIWGSKKRLTERMTVKGHVDEVRALYEKGTVVIVPTHFSNLDSILVGYAIDTFVGLPAFSYGAGLNLYNTGYTAYFMNRMGAYRVDRRKKNPVYLETLKAMSNLAIQRGVNSIFFPGGTRSRSGALESKFKLGLMGTVVEAQRGIYQDGKDEKVFIIPLVISYHFVLEAQFLIEQHLKRIGKERYIRSKDDFYSLRKILKFAWEFFSKSNDITLSFGQPLDVLGHAVNADGESFDKYGNPIDLREYFMKDGGITEDLQRERQYTRLLGDRIMDRYYRDNIVLTSHLVCFAAFELLKYQNSRLDLYGVLRLPTDDFIFERGMLYEVVEQLRGVLLEMEKAGRLKLSEAIHLDVARLVQDGIERVGTYHIAKPLLVNKKGQIVSQSFKVLFYYHNRLEHYGLANKIIWPHVKAGKRSEPVVAS